MLVITGAADEPIPDITVEYYFFADSSKVPIGGVLVDYLDNFQYGDTQLASNVQFPTGFTTFSPFTLTAPSSTSDTALAPASFRYFEIITGTDVPAEIPGTGTLVIYFTAHLARSPVWLNDLESNFPVIVNQISWVDDSVSPHYGASYFPGASPHFTLDISGVGKKAIPIPVPPAPLGTITGHKWNDVNVNGIYDAGTDVPLENWVINCEGIIEGIPITIQNTTDSNGLYMFTLLSGGGWTVSEDEILTGWAPSPGTLTSILVTLPLPAAGPYGAEGSYEANDVDFFNFQPTSATTTLLSDTTITLGDSVTDTATVTTNAGTPTGTVDFQVSYDGGAFADFDSDVALVGGSATSASYMPLAAGSYRFRAIYSGDTNYAGSQSDDDEEPLSVTPADSTTATLLSATEIVLGNSVTDTVTVTGLGGSFPGPTGTVDFEVSTDMTVWTKVGATKNLVSGSATSDSYTPLATGTYYFRAIYSGDTNYAGSQSDDDEEPLSVTPADSTTATLLSATEITLGETVYDTAHVAGLGGSYPVPTGTVQFFVQAPGGSFVELGTLVNLDSNGDANSIVYTPTIPGTYYFKAVYSGDSNYFASESGDEEEPIDVLSVLVPTRTIGFWQTHTDFTIYVFDSYLGGSITIGSGSRTKTIDSSEILFGAFYASIPKNHDKTDRLPEIDQKRMILLQQLVGAILNHAANGMPLPIDPVTGYDIITAGHNAFSGDDADEMTRVKGLLEDYNMSGDDLSFPAGLPPQGKATPQESKKLAKDGGIEFWDSPLFTT